MSRIAVSGFGAVSPAGWGLGALRAALAHGKPLPPKAVPRPGWTRRLWVCEVPPVLQPPPFLAHPRLRRASPLSQYVCGAGLEALEAGGGNASSSPGRLGLIVSLLCGAVRYSYRFFEETLLDPATASPVLFPETVFNAPASHLASVLGREPLSCTLIGEPGTFLQAVALGAEWLNDGLVDGCLVIGAEETNWLLADVLWHFDHGAVLAGGAGALYLTRLSALTRGVELSLVTDPQLYSTVRSRAAAVLAMRQLLPAGAPDELLCDSAKNRPRSDAAEARAWQDWPGTRLSPGAILGDGLMASGAWQCVAACDLLAQGQFRAAHVSIVGPSQQAIGARLSSLARPENQVRPSPGNAGAGCLIEELTTPALSATLGHVSAVHRPA